MKDFIKGSLRVAVLAACIGLTVLACSNAVGEPDKQPEKGTTSYARHNEAQLVGTCGMHSTIIQEWEYEGHKYLIVAAEHMIHSESCPCKNK